MKHDRINVMEQYIQQHQSLTNEDLCERFHISVQTLRRDIDILVQRGNIGKVYGGVVWENREIKSYVEDSQTRNTSNTSAKEKIGKIAAKEVNDGDVIFIDSGTTAYRMVKHLVTKNNITIITHSIDVVIQVQGYNQLRLIVLGGQYNNSTNSIFADTSEVSYKVDKAFIATVGVDSKGCSNTNLPEGKIKKYMIEEANKTYLLADHSKFKVRAFNRFASLEKFDVIVSNQKSPEWLNEICHQYDITYIHQ